MLVNGFQSSLFVADLLHCVLCVCVLCAVNGFGFPKVTLYCMVYFDNMNSKYVLFIPKLYTGSVLFCKIASFNGNVSMNEHLSAR